MCLISWSNASPRRKSNTFCNCFSMSSNLFQRVSPMARVSPPKTSTPFHSQKWKYDPATATTKNIIIKFIGFCLAGRSAPRGGYSLSVGASASPKPLPLRYPTFQNHHLQRDLYLEEL